jgi:hypothetical protein
VEPEAAHEAGGFAVGSVGLVLLDRWIGKVVLDQDIISACDREPHGIRQGVAVLEFGIHTDRPDGVEFNVTHLAPVIKAELEASILHPCVNELLQVVESPDVHVRRHTRRAAHRRADTGRRPTTGSCEHNDGEWNEPQGSPPWMQHESTLEDAFL